MESRELQTGAFTRSFQSRGAEEQRKSSVEAVGSREREAWGYRVPEPRRAWGCPNREPEFHKLDIFLFHS